MSYLINKGLISTSMQISNVASASTISKGGSHVRTPPNSLASRSHSGKLRFPTVPSKSFSRDDTGVLCAWDKVSLLFEKLRAPQSGFNSQV